MIVLICFSYCYSCKKYLYIVFPFSTLSTPLPAFVIRSFFFCIQIRPFLITQRTVSRNALIFSFVSSMSFEVRKRQLQILLGQYRISNFLSCSSEFFFVLTLTVSSLRHKVCDARLWPLSSLKILTE